MAEEGPGRDSIILSIVLFINMIAVMSFGFYLYGKHSEAEKAKIIKENLSETKNSADTELKNSDSAGSEKKIDNAYTRKVVRFESLITNLAGEDGRRIARISLEAKCEGDSVLIELNALKPKIRDIIIVTVGNSSAEELTSNEGKENFKSKLREQINSVLATGKVSEIYITELEIN